jgi:hypothetical protein
VYAIANDPGTIAKVHRFRFSFENPGFYNGALGFKGACAAREERAGEIGARGAGAQTSR